MESAAIDQKELPLQAAEIAAAMLRFQEPLAHVPGTHTPAGMPAVGVDAYAFVPSSRPVSRNRLAEHLAALPSPAFLAPTTARGVVGLVLLHELGEERRAAMQRQLDNHAAVLAELAPGSGSDRVLLEFDEESHVFSLAAVRLWARRFVVLVGWNIGPCGDPSRAEWQINLFAGDGRRFSSGAGRRFDR
ncbi:MAG: hypothetical protein AB7Q69_09425 [Gemmatimonadales bacterium]